MTKYKSILTHQRLGIEVGIDDANKAHLIKIFGKVVGPTGGGGGGDTPSDLNIENGAGNGSIMQKRQNPYNNTITGANGFAFGAMNRISGNESAGLGSINIVSGLGCIGIGDTNTVAGTNNYAIGHNNNISSSDRNNLAIGYDNQVPQGDNNVLLGNGLVGANSSNFFLGIGKYNHVPDAIKDNVLFTLGNGTDANNKANLAYGTNDGKLYIKGVGGYNGTNSGDENLKDLATVISEGGGESNIEIKVLEDADSRADWSGIFGYSYGYSVSVSFANWLKDAAKSTTKPYILYFGHINDKTSAYRFQYFVSYNTYTIKFYYFGSSTTGLDTCTVKGTIVDHTIATVTSISVTLAS